MNNIEVYLDLPSTASESIVACVFSSTPPRQAIVLTKTDILSELDTPFLLLRGNKTLYLSNIEIKLYIWFSYCTIFRISHVRFHKYYEGTHGKTQHCFTIMRHISGFHKFPQVFTWLYIKSPEVLRNSMLYA